MVVMVIMVVMVVIVIVIVIIVIMVLVTVVMFTSSPCGLLIHGVFRLCFGLHCSLWFCCCCSCQQYPSKLLLVNGCCVRFYCRHPHLRQRLILIADNSVHSLLNLLLATHSLLLPTELFWS